MASVRARIRRRGATFTMIVIVFSMIILASAGLFMGATRNAFTQVAFQVRQTRAREAAFAGVTWAARAAGSSQAETRGVLQLKGIQVEVSYQLLGEQKEVLKVSSSARETGLTIDVEAVLRKVGTRYLLDSYTLR